MRKRLLLLFLLMLTGTSGFCQNTYPKKVVFEGDTLIAITNEQLIRINLAIASDRRYQAENDLLRQEVQISDSIIGHWKTIATLQDSVIRVTQSKVLAMEQLNQTFGDLLLQQKKKDLKSTIGVGVGGILLGLTAGLLLVK